MKRMLCFVAVMLSAAACTEVRVYRVVYDIDLKGVTRLQEGNHGREFSRLRGHVFEDEFIKATWQLRETEVGLTLLNKTDAVQRILWDQTTYVGIDGKSDRIVHRGVSDWEVPIPPTVVSPGDTLVDFVQPRRWVAPLVNGSDSFAISPYNPFSSVEKEMRSRHGTITILLPIDTNGTLHSYLFTFSLKGNAVFTGWSS